MGTSVSIPIRAQYLRAKRQFAHAILFFRLGDCYEMFGDDAPVGARELNLALTVRQFTGGERVPACSVPHHAVEAYLTRLVSAGYTVAICEQIGDPRTATGIVEREVVRVVTPFSSLARRHRSTLDCPQGGGGVAPVLFGGGMVGAGVSGTPSAVTTGARDVDSRDTGTVRAGKSMPVAMPVVQLALFDGIAEPVAP